MKKRNKLLLYLFALAVIALYVVIYAVPSLTGALTKTELLEYQSFQVTDSATCYLIRDEQVYAAASAGEINYYIEDGVQVRKGVRLLAVTPKNSEQEESAYGDIITRLSGDAVTLVNFAAEFNGIVSYYIDGYENYFTPETMRDLNYDAVKNLKIEPINVVRQTTLAGEPLYKICDNNEWYVTCWVKPGNISKYEVGKNVSIKLPAGDVKAKIVDILDDGDMWQVIFESNRYYADFGKTRSADATIITSDYSGIVIRNSSLATEEGQIGVYVVSKSGDYVFTPVKSIASDGEETLVESGFYYDAEGKKVNTVEIYDEILKKPEQNK